MLVGHLPAGYLAVRASLRRLQLPARQRRQLMATALVASVAPDFDLAYFYTLGGDIHHHAYPSHWPITWVAVAAVGGVAGRVLGRRMLMWGAVVAGAGGLLHTALDSIAGRIRWGAPFSAVETTLVEVPTRTPSWIVNMMTHWTFAVEIVIVLAAVAVWWRRRG